MLSDSRVMSQALHTTNSPSTIDSAGSSQQPAGIPDGDRACDDRDRADRIAEHVDEGAADIEVVLARAAEREHDARVQNQAQSGDHDHDRLLDRLRIPQAQRALVEDPAGQADQGQGIHERRQHARAVIAVRFDVVRRLVLQVEADRRQQQRPRIREVMAGVGEESERVGLDASPDLDENEQEGRHQRPAQDLSRAEIVMVV